MKGPSLVLAAGPQRLLIFSGERESIDDDDILRARGPAMKGFLDVVQTLGLCVVAGALIHIVRRLGRVIDDGAESLQALLTRPPDIDRLERRIEDLEASIDANGASIEALPKRPAGR